VFISYRREDSPGHAGRIFDNLRARLGSDVVFMDVHAIDAGVDFAEALEDAIGSCDALLAIIGPSWISATDADGRRRLDDPRDFVRIEIGGALKRNVRVVPVLVENADMPTQDDLPDEIKALTRLNAVAMRDARWDADIDALVRSVERLITPPGRDERVPRDRARPGASTGRRNWLWGAAAGTMALAAVAILGPRACAPDSNETLPATTTSPDTRSEPTASQLPTAQQSPPPTRRGRLGVGWFGLWLDTVTDTPPGVIVGRISSGGPAASAGIQVDDVLIEVAGKPVRSFSDVADAVVNHVKSTPPGTSAIVEVVRNGTHLRLPVVFDRDFVLR